MLKLPAVRRLALVLLTIKLPLVHVDALVGIELMKNPISVPKEKLASLSIVMLPVGMLAQAYVSKSFAGKDSKPLHVFLSSYKARLLIGSVISAFVLVLREMTAGGSPIPTCTSPVRSNATRPRSRAVPILPAAPSRPLRRRRPSQA